jgi:hypothetical protein
VIDQKDRAEISSIAFMRATTSSSEFVSAPGRQALNESMIVSIVFGAMKSTTSRRTLRLEQRRRDAAVDETGGQRLALHGAREHEAAAEPRVAIELAVEEEHGSRQ